MLARARTGLPPPIPPTTSPWFRPRLRQSAERAMQHLKFFLSGAVGEAIRMDYYSGGNPVTEAKLPAKLRGEVQLGGSSGNDERSSRTSTHIARRGSIHSYQAWRTARPTVGRLSRWGTTRWTINVEWHHHRSEDRRIQECCPGNHATGRDAGGTSREPARAIQSRDGYFRTVEGSLRTRTTGCSASFSLR